MKLTTITSFLALASSIAAASLWSRDESINQHDAKAYVDTFIGVYGKTDPNAAATANKIIADNFVEKSESINALKGTPFVDDNVAAASKADWINGVLHAPTVTKITTKQVLVAGNMIVWTWRIEGVGSGKYPVEGYNLFQMKKKGKQWQCEQLVVEFDSLAWGLDTGFHCSYRNGTVAPV